MFALPRSWRKLADQRTDPSSISTAGWSHKRGCARLNGKGAMCLFFFFLFSPFLAWGNYNAFHQSRLRGCALSPKLCMLKCAVPMTSCIVEQRQTGLYFCPSARMTMWCTVGSLEVMTAGKRLQLRSLDSSRHPGAMRVCSICTTIPKWCWRMLNRDGTARPALT